MNVSQMREKIKEVYPWGPWGKKVDAMPDHQVAAVYQRLLSEKKIS